MINRPTEVDEPKVVRQGLIEKRNKALSRRHFDADLVVLLSHAIAWLGYLVEVDERNKRK